MVKTTRITLLMMLTVLLACAQTKKSDSASDQDSTAVEATDTVGKEVQDTIATEKGRYHKETAFGNVSIYLELPDGKGAVSSAIRTNLWDKLTKTLGADLNYNSEENALPPYRGEKDLKKMCLYYGNVATKEWFDCKKAEYNEKVEYITKDLEMSDDDKQNALRDTSRYGFEVRLQKIKETPKYVIFHEFVYGETGGAHGGVYGMGSITYDRKSGKELRLIIKPGVTRAIQPLLRRGLKEYFADEGQSKKMTDAELYDQLMIDGKVIPLPQQYNVCPSKNGIDFVYGQYEIACYAAGMPSFTIPYSDIEPYLTDEAKKVFLNHH